MIPVHLELTNFLAYRGPVAVDFSGLHVAVLVGDNGAGKSSLLDGLTWAVWGRARAKRDEELVHQGQTDMRVVFAFSLAGQVYRVTRAKRIGRGGAPVLSLHAALPDGRWNDLSEATIPKTQQKIIDLIKLDYETFINSAYLMQGHADEFTGKRPTERKQVLADILGLQQWEGYEARARERLRTVDASLGAIDARLAEIDQDLARRAEFERDLTQARERVGEVTVRLRQAEEGWARLDAARQTLTRLQRQIDDLANRLQAAAADLAALETELTQARARADVEKLTRDLAALDERLAALAEREAERERLAAERQALGEQVAGLRAQNDAVRQEAETLKQRILSAQAETDRARRQLQAAADETARGLRRQAQSVRADGERLLERRAAEVKTETARLAARVRALAETTAPLCPTCGQALTESARAQLIDDLRAEAARREADLAQEAQTEREHRQTQAAALEAEAAERLARAEQELQAEMAERAQLTADLEVQVEARREQYRLNQNQLKALTDQQADVERQLTAAADVLKGKPGLLARQADLKINLAQADEARARIVELEVRRERWTAARQADQGRLAALETEADQAANILRDSAAQQRALDNLRQEDTFAKARLGAVEQKLAALDDQARQRIARLEERARLAEERGLLDELKEACGKKGVPAMIIETAVPEIEAAANVLLASMTGGRMHVRFNTQRETLSGDVRETLDIQIADELGTRAYEMYSGGEAFRVNFAIRVALSQLLARRAGTRLQTLIMDEGFGVLDAAGRERLVEAINAVQNDFERILVVTHIDELKDLFPARIEVTKGPDGSQVNVI